jgi:hypothetical protein
MAVTHGNVDAVHAYGWIMREREGERAEVRIPYSPSLKNKDLAR